MRLQNMSLDGFSSLSRKVAALEVKLGSITADPPPSLAICNEPPGTLFMNVVLAQKQKSDVQTQTTMLTKLHNEFMAVVKKIWSEMPTMASIVKVCHIAVQLIEDWTPKLIKALCIAANLVSGFKLQSAIALVQLVLPQAAAFVEEGIMLIENIVTEVVDIKNEIWKKAPEPLQALPTELKVKKKKFFG